MTYQDQMVKLTQRAVMDLIDAVEALPPSHRDWQPSPGSRSALNQLREIAMGPRYLNPLLSDFRSDSFALHGPGGITGGEEEMETLDQIRNEALNGLAAFCQHVAHVPDEKLDEEVILPFAGGTTMTLADVLALHYWNATYHLGQVNYIASLIANSLPASSK